MKIVDYLYPLSSFFCLHMYNLLTRHHVGGHPPTGLVPLFGVPSLSPCSPYFFYLPLSIAFRSSLRSTPFLNPFLSVCCPSGTGVLDLLAYRQFPISRPTFIPMLVLLYFIIYVFICTLSILFSL
ncbi:hypothetical protein D1872_36820 [compost metagenome]